MALAHLSDSEIVLSLSKALREWRVEPSGAGMTQEELARRSGISLTSLKRFEKTGKITLGNFVSILRGLGLLDRLEALVPERGGPSPLELLERSRAASSSARARAPRKKRDF